MSETNVATTIDSAEFTNRLEKLDVKIDVTTLRNWSKKGLIPSYETFYEHRVKKRGRPPDPGKAEKQGIVVEDRTIKRGRPGIRSSWPIDALEQAAALSEVLKKSGAKNASTDKIKAIKRAAALVYERRYVIYSLPQVVGSPLRDRQISHKDIQLHFVPPNFKGLELFPGADNAEKADVLNALVVTWITTIAKVQFSTGLEAKLHDVMSEEEISLRLWPVSKPARIILLSWWEPIVGYHNGEAIEGRNIKFHPDGFLWPCESDRDEVVLWENNVDTRKLFNISYDDSKAHTEELYQEWEARYFGQVDQYVRAFRLLKKDILFTFSAT